MNFCKSFLVSAVLIAPAFAAEAGAFDSESDGYAWRAASVEVRQAYCEAAAVKAQATKPGVTAKFIFDAINQFYASDIAEVRKRKLKEVTAMVVADYD